MPMKKYKYPKIPTQLLLLPVKFLWHYYFEFLCVPHNPAGADKSEGPSPALPFWAVVLLLACTCAEHVARMGLDGGPTKRRWADAKDCSVAVHQRAYHAHARWLNTIAHQNIPAHIFACQRRHATVCSHCSRRATTRLLRDSMVATQKHNLWCLYTMPH